MMSTPHKTGPHATHGRRAATNYSGARDRLNFDFQSACSHAHKNRWFISCCSQRLD